MIRGTGTPLLWRQVERVELVQLGEKIALRTSNLRSCKRVGEGLFTWPWNDRTRGKMALNLKRVDLDQILGRNILLWRWYGSVTGCPKKLLMPYLWKYSRPRWTTLGALVWQKVSLCMAGGLEQSGEITLMIWTIIHCLSWKNPWLRYSSQPQ